MNNIHKTRHKSHQHQWRNCLSRVVWPTTNCRLIHKEWTTKSEVSSLERGVASWCAIIWLSNRIYGNNLDGTTTTTSWTSGEDLIIQEFWSVSHGFSCQYQKGLTNHCLLICTWLLPFVALDFTRVEIHPYTSRILRTLFVLLFLSSFWVETTGYHYWSHCYSPFLMFCSKNVYHEEKKHFNGNKNCNQVTFTLSLSSFCFLFLLTWRVVILTLHLLLYKLCILDSCLLHNLKYPIKKTGLPRETSQGYRIMWTLLMRTSHSTRLPLYHCDFSRHSDTHTYILLTQIVLPFIVLTTTSTAGFLCQEELLPSISLIYHHRSNAWLPKKNSYFSNHFRT